MKNHGGDNIMICDCIAYNGIGDLDTNNSKKTQVGNVTL